MGTQNLFEPRRDLVCLDCPVGLVLGEIVMADFQLLLSLSFGPSQLLLYIDAHLLWPPPSYSAVVALCYRAILVPSPDQRPACVLDADIRRVCEHR